MVLVQVQSMEFFLAKKSLTERDWSDRDCQRHKRRFRGPSPRDPVVMGGGHISLPMMASMEKSCVAIDGTVSGTTWSKTSIHGTGWLHDSRYHRAG